MISWSGDPSKVLDDLPTLFRKSQGGAGRGPVGVNRNRVDNPTPSHSTCYVVDPIDANGRALVKAQTRDRLAHRSRRGRLTETLLADHTTSFENLTTRALQHSRTSDRCIHGYPDSSGSTGDTESRDCPFTGPEEWKAGHRQHGWL